jgi:AcrR family transcriptional regulator
LGRRPNPQRKIEVLEEVTTHILERGLHQTPMRALANDLGTSTYTFVYHFGSKDGMLRAVLDRVADQHREAIGQLAATTRGTIGERICMYWAWSTAEAQLAVTSLVIDALSLAKVDPDLYGSAASRHVETLEEFLAGECRATGVDPATAGPLATAIVGLQFWFIATRDDTAAQHRLKDLVQALT